MGKRLLIVLPPCAAGLCVVLWALLDWSALVPILVLAAALAAVCVLAVFLEKGRGQAERAVLEREALLEQERAASDAALERMEKETKDRSESFRSLLSHDLRMPISIIQGYAELLYEDAVTDPATRKEYLEKILQRTQYMSESLSRQLTNTRQEDYIPPVCARMELLELARQSAGDMANSAGCRGIGIQVISADPEIWVHADCHQVGKIFFNLVENAIKYMSREGMITIRLSKGEGMAHVSVKDDGMGLSEEETKRVFELHFQGSNRIPGQGHGHGLYLVKRAVEDQGGSISAVSRPGQGMTVAFTLPLAGAASPAAAAS